MSTEINYEEANPPITLPSTKLSRVQGELESNPIIYVSHPQRNCFTEVNDNFYRGDINFYIASRIPIYTVKEMNQFLESLIKNTEPTNIQRAEEYEGEYGRTIKLGELRFEEKVATRSIPIGTTHVEIEDAREHLEYLLEQPGEGRKYDVVRRIVVRLYPHSALARLLYEYDDGLFNDSHEMMCHPGCDLEFYREQVDQRMINFLKNKRITSINLAELTESKKIS